MKLILLLIIVWSLCKLLFHYRDMKLLRSVSSPKRGNKSERRLIIKMLKKHIPPHTIFHDLYLPKKNGEYSQIDVVVVLPQGLVCIELKDYSGWIFGNEDQTYWTQILNYGKEKHRFYNPIKQNIGHISTLKSQSHQFHDLPIFNVVLFTNAGELKDVTYYNDNVFVTYTSKLMKIFKRINKMEPANYTNKSEVFQILKEAVRNGENEELVAQHIATVKEYSKHTPKARRSIWSWLFRW